MTSTSANVAALVAGLQGNGGRQILRKIGMVNLQHMPKTLDARKQMYSKPIFFFHLEIEQNFLLVLDIINIDFFSCDNFGYFFSFINI